MLKNPSNQSNHIYTKINSSYIKSFYRFKLIKSKIKTWKVCLKLRKIETEELNTVELWDSELKEEFPAWILVSFRRNRIRIHKGRIDSDRYEILVNEEFLVVVMVSFRRWWKVPAVVRSWMWEREPREKRSWMRVKVNEREKVTQERESESEKIIKNKMKWNLVKK